MAASERSEKARLRAILGRLEEFKPADLVREDLRDRNLSFSNGQPYFERTLGLFRELGHGSFAKLPAAYIKILADHAERVRTQFDEILHFTGEGLPNPHEVRNHLVGEVREYYRELHDDLSFLISRPPGHQQRPTRAPWYVGAPLAMLMLAMLVAGAAAAYYYGLVGFAAQDIMDSLRDIARQ